MASLWSKIYSFFAPSPSSKRDIIITTTDTDILLYAINLITRPERVQFLFEKIEKIKRLPPAEQENISIQVYLELEKYLIEKEPIRKYTQEGLRKEIREKFNPEERGTRFFTLFLEDWLQRLKFVELLIVYLKEKWETVLGEEGFQRMLSERTTKTVFAGVKVKEGEISWDIPKAKLIKLSKAERAKQLTSASSELISTIFERMEELGGKERAIRSIENAYYSIQKDYGFLPMASEIVKILPRDVLEEERVVFLSREELEKKVMERTSALTQKVEETEHLARELEDAKNATLNILEDLKQEKTGLAEAVEGLKELDKLKDNFLNIATHELKTPLVPIKSQAQLLLSGDYGELTKEQRKALEMIFRNEEQLDKLISDVLDITKVKSKKLKFIFENTAFEEIIVDAVENVEKFAREKYILLTLSPVSKLPKIFIDRRRMSQVMGNLLDNALKFTPEKGRVEIEVKKIKNDIVVSIKDTGIGMSKETLKKLFTPFFQAKSDITRKYGGTGLGLSICKGLIEAHGGKIWAESQGEGKGSIFTFTLPIKRSSKV